MKKLTFLSIMILLSACFAHEPEKPKRQGQVVPSFKMMLTDSMTYFKTNDIPAGKPFVLFYFGPYCPYSRAQMEEIVNSTDALKDINFYALTIAPLSEVKEFSEHYQLSKHKNITVGIDYNNFFSGYFETNLVPCMAIYGKDRKLNDVFIGNTQGNQIKRSAEL